MQPATVLFAPDVDAALFEIIDHADRRCCKSLTTKDSLRESIALDAVHEQAITRPLSHDELVQLQRIVAEARIAADPG
jgi:hypothetical protein